MQFVARQQGQGGQTFNRFNDQAGFNKNAMPRPNAQKGGYQPFGQQFQQRAYNQMQGQQPYMQVQNQTYIQRQAGANVPQLPAPFPRKLDWEIAMERMQKELLEAVRGEIEKQKNEIRTMMVNNPTPRPQNALPSQTEVNPNAKINQVGEITLRSGKQTKGIKKASDVLGRNERHSKDMDTTCDLTRRNDNSDNQVGTREESNTTKNTNVDKAQDGDTSIRARSPLPKPPVDPSTIPFPG